jgi:hypothetical protein
MEIVHVIGLSKSGKSTLIRKLADADNVTLRNHFKVSGVVKAFIDQNHKSFGKDPLWLPTADIVKHARESSDNCLIIHKWQYGTKELPHWEDLRQFHQRAIVLWISECEWKARCQISEFAPTIECWKHSILPELNRLVGRIEIDVVYGGLNYPRILSILEGKDVVLE